MSTKSGARGSWRALRTIPFGLLALFGVLAVGLAGNATQAGAGHIVLSGYGSSGLAPLQPAKSPPDSTDARVNGTFKIAGSVTGLFPGSSHTLKLTVTNPQTFIIVVTSIATTVHNASAACTAANLSVGAFSGQLLVPASASANVTVHATLAYSAPNGCIGKKFPLVYTGLAKA